jgi:hypothetical protein
MSTKTKETNELVIKSEFDINQDHLINLAIADVEDSLFNTKDLLQEEIASVSAESKDIITNINKLRDEELNKIFGKDIDNIVKSAKKMGVAIKRKCDANFSLFGEKSYGGGYSITGAASATGICMNVSLSGSSRDNKLSMHYTDTIEIDIPPAITKAIKAYLAKEAIIDKLTDHILLIGERISNMGRMERRAKGNLGRIFISKLKGGTDLISSIKKEMVKGDPALKELIDCTTVKKLLK